MIENNDKQHDGKRSDVRYAHNPRYCMILPDADESYEEDIVSTGQS